VKAVNVGVKNARDWKPEENLPLTIAALASAKRILCTMHRHPDGDALGSALALAAALRESGREVVVYNPDDLPYNFRFLPGADRVVRTLSAAERFDATVATDSGSASRLGPDVPSRDRRGTFINLDHHITTEPFGDINYVDPAAAAVGVLVHKIIRGLGLQVSRDAATCIYASILADTGCFRYASTDPEALRCAAELLEAGVDPWEMTVQVYEQQPLARMKLLADVLGTLEVCPGGKLATLTITNAMKARHSASHDHTDGFINHARGIDGVEVAASFTEPEPRPIGAPHVGLADGATPEWRVSFRSRGNVDVSAIAQKFGGGGHRNAAGCAIKGSEAELRTLLAAEIDLALAARA
jgi:phosphoesterase RecJ-like protein